MVKRFRPHSTAAVLAAREALEGAVGDLVTAIRTGRRRLVVDAAEDVKRSALAEARIRARRERARRRTNARA